MRVSTSVGSIFASLIAGRLLDSFLATGNGDITVVIPSNLGVNIRAVNNMADNMKRIVSDFRQVQARLTGTAPGGRRRSQRRRTAIADQWHGWHDIRRNGNDEECVYEKRWQIGAILIAVALIAIVLMAARSGELRPGQVAADAAPNPRELTPPPAPPAQPAPARARVQRQPPRSGTPRMLGVSVMDVDGARAEDSRL